MKVRRVKKISAPLQSLGRDFRPDRFVSVQRGLGQIEKSQAHPEEKNGNPNEADSCECHRDSLWLLAEMVNAFKKRSTAVCVGLSSRSQARARRRVVFCNIECATASCPPDATSHLASRYGRLSRNGRTARQPGVARQVGVRWGRAGAGVPRIIAFFTARPQCRAGVSPAYYRIFHCSPTVPATAFAAPRHSTPSRSKPSSSWSCSSIPSPARFCWDALF